MMSTKNGMHFDEGTFEPNQFVDIIEVEVPTSDGTTEIKRFGLTSDNIIETYDAGNQYVSDGKLKNQWTDIDGNMLDNAYSDYLYCDFEIAFTDGDAAIYNNPDYKAGLVFEICGKSDGSFDPGATYNTNTDNLKTAIKDILKSSETGGNGKFNNGTDEAPKNRSIQVNPIETSSLTNRSRIEYAKPYRNVYKTTASGEKSYTNGAYIYKVSAYLIKGDTVILSNSVNVCLYDVATKDFASTDMCVYTP